MFSSSGSKTSTLLVSTRNYFKAEIEFQTRASLEKHLISGEGIEERKATALKIIKYVALNKSFSLLLKFILWMNVVSYELFPRDSPALCWLPWGLDPGLWVMGPGSRSPFPSNGFLSLQHHS